MRKTNNGALSLLSLACLTLLSFSHTAHAQPQQVQDAALEATTVSIYNLLVEMNGYVHEMAGMFGEIQGAILDAMDGAGDGAYDERLLMAITGMDPGNPRFTFYNTNYILSGGALDGEDPPADSNSPVSKYFNLLSLSGGIPRLMRVGDPALYNNDYFDYQTYNNNSLLQNALLGPSATGHTNLTTMSTADADGALLWTNNALYDTNAGTIASGTVQMDNPAAVSGMLVNRAAYSTAIAKPLHYNDGAKRTPDTMANDPARAFKFRCDMGFNPNWEGAGDAESDLVLAINNRCNRSHNHVRKDRQLNSLLNHMQYVAPPDMQDLAFGTPSYYRWQTMVTSSSHSDYIDVIAAASFCMNVSLKAYPVVPASSDQTRLDIATAVMYRETIDSKIVSDCWQFFEERVAYPQGASASFGTLHERQAALCHEDYNKRIINEEQMNHCNQYGRSALQARRDLAYRAYSPTYIRYLNSLGVQTRELILAQALSEIERFEQTLLMERQIMTEAMALPERPPISKSYDRSSTKIRVEE